MKDGIWVSKNGRVSEASGLQPRDALLFAPHGMTSEDLLQEQRSALQQNIKLIRTRLAEATRR
ncbi:hypothetical protein SAMN05444162_1406 [Paenibacillaceae bacterium GAS479]|nr:hypothetical protein SAMN05444162_1406 [Paenibacillaceae bacterium GAS479]